MEEPRLFADHLGIYTIMPPKDMPLTVIAMLQETIKEAWASYGGVPENAEQFWNHLVGNGSVDVPRETSPSVEDRFPCLVDVVYQVNGGAYRTAQRKVMARDALEAIAQVRAGLVAAFKNDNVHFVGQPDVRWVLDGGSVVTDVPRETSGGDDASA